MDGFTDVRELLRRVKAAGLKPATEADESTTGPARFVVIDRTAIRCSSTNTSDGRPPMVTTSR